MAAHTPGGERHVLRSLFRHSKVFDSPQLRLSFFLLVVVIHSRMYAGQFLSTIPFVSHRERKTTASRLTRVTSFKSKTIRMAPSDLSKLSTSAMFSVPILPLSAITTPPLALLWALSISSSSVELMRPDRACKFRCYVLWFATPAVTV